MSFITKDLILLSLVILFGAFILAPSHSFTALSRISTIISHLQQATTKSLGIRSFSTLKPSMAYDKELQIALLAVARASILTKSVFHAKAKGTLSKDDASPVTIGDFGAQALIISAIKHNFPDDEVVGEEEASSLRGDKGLSSKIWDLVKDVKLDDGESDGMLGGADQE